MTEAELMDEVRLVLGAERDACWWRNNVGVAKLAGGHVVRYGVGNPGGADLIGLFRGRFCAIEAKSSEGRQTPAQRKFGRLVESKGGIYVVVRSVDDAQALLERLASEVRR